MRSVTVKLLVGLSGPAGSWQAGDNYTCDPEEADRLISARFAVPVGAVVEKTIRAPKLEKRKAG